MLMTPIRTALPATALLAMLTCVFACNPPQEDKQASATTASTDTIPLVAIDSFVINGVLPVLWIEATEFQKLRGQPAFRFYVDSNNDLTLSAWNAPYNDQPPVFTLKTSTLTNVKAGRGNYLGNLVLKSQDRADIENDIRTGNWTKVKFVPRLDTRPGATGQVTYFIEPTNESLPPRVVNPKDPLYFRRDTAATVPLAGYLLNPSPPRNE
jgi:hypothetical protein